MLEGKSVVVGVTGGIAVYKMCDFVSRLKKEGADVNVVMTANATRFVAPLTFETLSGNRVISDMFDRDFPWEVEHISLAKKADVFVVAPCTANFMAKLVTGIADDFLSTTLLAAKCPVVLAPAMNTNMLENAATQNNIRVLQERGFYFVEADEGRLACGDVGKGRLAPVDDIYKKVTELILPKNDFSGKTVLISAGATREALDPVRFITNRSSGKMGLALCSAVKRRGGQVILVAGHTDVPLRDYDELVRVQTTEEMYAAVLEKMDKSDIIIKAAAPCDYRAKSRSGSKIKSQKLTLELEKNPDIAASVGMQKGNRRLVVFCAETENLLENAAEKLKSKNADMVVANDVTQDGAGFDVDTNVVTLLTKTGSESFPKMLKRDLSDIILDKIAQL